MKNFIGAWHVSGGLGGKERGVDYGMDGKPKVAADSNIIVTVGRGTVNGYEPIVSGFPISGIGADGNMRDGGPPSIRGKFELDVYGRCYVCIKLKINPKTGKMNVPPTESDLTIKISKHTELGESEEYWWHPIAVFSRGGVLAQVAYFDFIHYASKRPKDPLNGATGDFVYHYFVPA